MPHASVAEVQRTLRGIAFPAEKQQLVEHAKEAGAKQEVVSELEKLPNQTFKNPADVNHALEASEMKEEEKMKE